MSSVVNVVIPVYKPDEKLIKLVKMLDKQTSPVEKVIFMVTVGSDDFDNLSEADKATISMIKESVSECTYEYHIEKIKRSEFDHGGTRRAGALLASENCEYILFMTQDAVPEDENLIASMLKKFNDTVAAAYARQTTTEKSSLAEKFTRQFNYPDEDKIKTEDDIKTLGIKAFFCSNVCAMYKRSVYEELGGFVKKTIFNEDMIFANKLLKSGYSIAYASKAKVVHTHDFNGMEQFKRNFDLAVSQTLNPQAFFGISSESEGVKYVMAAAKYFTKHKRPWLIIPFGINCVYKLLGYKMGRKVESLPESKILKYSSNPGFFKGLPMDGTIVRYVMNINGIE